MKKVTILILCLFLLLAAMLNRADHVWAGPITTRVSLTHDGQQANKDVMWPDMSADGRYAVFASAADNLLSDELPGATFHIFLRDLETSVITLVSKGVGNGPANGSSYYPAISGDGRYIAFASAATNLVTGDTNGMTDIFVYDRITDSTVRVSVATDGSQGNSMSWDAAIADDGTAVTFQSIASNLVNGDTNNVYDVFVHELESGTTTRVSLDDTGQQAAKQSIEPDISGNGRYVVFTSFADLTANGNTSTAIYLYDRATEATERISPKISFFSNDESFDAYISDDGRFVTYQSLDDNFVADDTNGTYDVFLYDRTSDTTRRVSVDSNGNEADGLSASLGLSGDGRYILFASDATNLVADDTNSNRDIFVHDALSGDTRRSSLSADSIEGNFGGSGPAALSNDGFFVLYQSASTNLVPDDTNNNIDLFLNGGGNTLAPITLTITRITDYSVELDTENAPDFFVKVWIVPNDLMDPPDFNNEIDYTVDESAITPFWVFSRQVDPFSSGTVVIEVWDKDTNTPDDQADISPVPGKDRIMLSIDTTTGKWSGDIEWPRNCARGDSETAVELCWDFSVLSDSGDADGDGLLDGWEGNGLDFNSDGVVDVDLPAIGADPMHKDIFVEIDYMDHSPNGSYTYQPLPEAIETVVNSFDNAPVDNPDGTTGVHLHVDSGEDAPLTWGTAVTWGSLSQADVFPFQQNFGDCTINAQGKAVYEWAAVDDLKATYFNTGRATVFHYNPWVYALCPEKFNTLGISRGIEASDFIVSLSGSRLAYKQTGTFMHELGHNLGLRHGGADQINRKPHYLSVMNYSYATSGLLINGSYSNYDYSRYDLPDLNEQQLDETVGLNPPAGITESLGILRACTFVLRSETNAETAVDWNCDGDTDDTDLVYDINGDGHLTQPLTSQTDWDKLVYTGGVVGALAFTGSLPATTIADDITEDDVIAPPETAVSFIYLPLIQTP